MSVSTTTTSAAAAVAVNSATSGSSCGFLFSLSSRAGISKYFYPVSSCQRLRPSTVTCQRLPHIMAMGASGNFQPPEEPGLPKPASPAWKNWMVGLVLSIILPSFRHKWGPLMVLRGKVNETIETLETVTEVAEELAEVVEKVADEVGDKLPDDTKLKDAMESVENLAKTAVKEAKVAEQLIHQVEGLEKDMENRLLSPDKDRTKKVEIPKML